MYKKKSQLTTSYRSATMRNINRNLNNNLGVGVLNVINNQSMNYQSMDYCNNVTGDLNQYYNSLKFTDIRDAKVFIVNSDVRGSKLSNVYFLTSCPNLAGCIREGISVVGNQGCDYSIVDSYITFTKDRTTTCITPLGENESILIDSMLTTDNNNWQFGGISYFTPLDISKVLELDATGFGLQSNNKNNRVSRFIFTNSLGKITITGSELISSPTGINSNHIYLDSNNRLNITKPINDFVYGENPSGFKLKINIKQEETSNFKEGTASVILEYRTVGDTSSASAPRCVINDTYGCLDY
jgi:hypothetical protein